jgi:hypothetical protein
MGREAGEERPEIAARLAVAPLGGGGDRADEVGALEADREVARAEEQALDDPTEARVGLPSFVRSAKNRRSRASSSRNRLSTTIRPTSSAASRRS